MDLTFIKESFFTYREALDCFSSVLTRNEEIRVMYWRSCKFAAASAGCSGAGCGAAALYSFRGVALQTWVPFVGTIGAAAVVAVISSIEALRNKEKANWCYQGLFPIARVRCQTGLKLTVCATVDTCLRVCSDSVRDCEQLTGYGFLFHSRGQENLLYRNSSEQNKVEEFLNEIQRKTGRDPRQVDFVRNGGYQAFLQDRREVLEAAIAKHEGIFTKISTMSV